MLENIYLTWKLGLAPLVAKGYSVLLFYGVRTYFIYRNEKKIQSRKKKNFKIFFERNSIQILFFQKKKKCFTVFKI